MKLKKLRIHNFVGIDNAEISFDKPISLFVGRNNQGKSTVPDAVEFALTGRCRAMQFNKDAPHIMRGPDGMLTELDVCDGGIAEPRTIRRTKSSIGINTDTREVLRYCLNPTQFIALPAKQRAKVLAEVLGGGMDDVTKAAIAEHIGDIDEAILSEIKGAGVNVLNIDALRAAVVEIRQSYKRLEKDLPDKAPLLADYDLAKDYNVTADQQAVNTLTERISKGADMLAEAKAMLQTKADILTLQKELKRIEHQYDTVPKLPSNVSEEKLNITPVYLSIQETMLDKGRKGEDGKCLCPICHTYTSIPALEEIYTELRDWMQKYQDILSSREIAIVDNNALDQQKAIKTKLLDEAKGRLKEVDMPKGGEDLLGQLQAERDAAQARIANFRRFEIDTQTFQAAGQRRMALHALITECNRIDEALKDGGPVKSAIAAGGRQLPINKSLLKLWGMEELSWSDNGEITLRNIPIEYASDSERYRAGCVMGMALAEVSGIGIVALDGFDILDSGNANAFIDTLAQCKLANVLLCVSTDKDYSQVELPDWLSAFYVEAGKITEIS